ncbi:MAG: phage tail protein [Pseudomonadota bacterium]|nr:phage tail protein [Pseudomonadota bacterium]
MPMPTDRINLLIAGKAHADWERYRVDSDLLTPADAWQASLGQIGGLPASVVEGALFELRVGDTPVMVGRIDDIHDEVGPGGSSLNISGRDLAGALLDCAAPLFTKRQATLDEIVAAIAAPYGLSKIRIDADATERREKVGVEPGDTAWNVLAHAAEANGLWPWMEPDGTLVVGGPDYTTPVQAHLLMRRDGNGNNLRRLARSRSMARRFSELTVLGQTHGTETAQGQHRVTGVVRDSGVGYHRPRIVTDHEANNPAIAAARANKLLADSRLDALTLTAEVSGHRIDAPGLPGHGKLWTPGMRIALKSEPHNLDGTYFLIARTFTGGRGQPSITTLTLKEDGVWTLDAHPHQRKHRRGKNDVPGQIVPLKP